MNKTNNNNKTKKKNIHIIFIHEIEDFIPTKDSHVKFIYL